MRLSLTSAVVVAAFLSGCINLGAVRSYTDSASDVVSSTQAAARWRDSEKELRSFRLPEDKCPLERPSRAPQDRFDKAFNEITVVHKALADYFTALGDLAADELPQTHKTAAGSLDAIKAAGVNVGETEKSAVVALFKVLDRGFDAYRHTKVRSLMVETHEDIATILRLMQKLSDLYAGEVSSERIQVIKFIGCSKGQNELLDPYLARREIKRVNDYYDSEEKKLSQYKSALMKISNDHARIRDALALNNRKQIEQTLRQIANTAKELRAAQQALSTL